MELIDYHLKFPEHLYCDTTTAVDTGSKRIYICGRMRGIKDFNYPAFKAATAYFRTHGYEVRSPAEKDLDEGFDGNLDDFDMRKAMQWDLEAVLWANYIALLPGWQYSQGAAMETAVARVTGKIPIIVVLAQDPDEVWRVDFVEMNTWDEIDIKFSDSVKLDINKLLGISQKEHESMLNNTNPIPEFNNTTTSDILIPSVFTLGYENSPLYEAYNLVHSDRGSNYGHPLDDFSRQALIFQAILGITVTPQQVALMMIGVKISRLVQTPGHHDSIVDIPGYAETYSMITDKLKEQAEEAKLAKFLETVEDLGLDPKPFWSEKDE